MRRVPTSLRAHALRLRHRLFSTQDHATTVIVDRAVLRRYQWKRAVVTVIAGMTGGIGIGISLSHSGAISVRPEIALGLPTVIGLLIALTFVFVPLPEIVRWLTLATVAVCFLVWQVDLTVELKIVAAVVGVVLSWLVAHLLQFGLGVADESIRQFRASMAIVAIAVLTAAALVTSSRAEAQSVAPCAPADLSVRVTDAGGATRAVGDGDEVDIDVPAGGATVVIVATSSHEYGTVSVELIDAAPIPLPGSWFPGVGSSDRVVWVGHLGEGEAPSGRTEPIPIDIRRRPGDLTYSVASPAHDASLHLVAGEGTYRATVTDAATGASCFIDVRIRILASPVSTPVGLAGLGGAIVGLGLLSGALLSGTSSRFGGLAGRVPWRPFERSPRRFDPAERVVSSSRLSFDVVRRERLRVDASGETWEITVGFRIDEDEHDVYEVEAREPKLLELIAFNPVVVFPGEAIPELTIQVRTDPTNVHWRAAALTVDVSSGGVGLGSQDVAVFDGAPAPSRPAAAEPRARTAAEVPESAVHATAPGHASEVAR